MTNQDIEKKLQKIAYQKTIPFCYQCYREAPTGTCKTCMNDDLMRLLPGSGCEYGHDWIVKELLEESLTPADVSEIFEQMIEDCYGETTNVGFLELCTVSVMKDQDPISWDMAKSEYIDGLEQDGELITFDNGSSYYWVSDIEDYLDEVLEEEP